MNKKVIYTCITGNYEKIIDHFYCSPNYDYVCFTDHLPENPKQFIWKFRPLQFSSLDNTRNNRWHKIHPHILFPEYDESIYVDGNIDILTNRIFQDVNRTIKIGNKLALQPHFVRRNLHEEFAECLRLEKDNKTTIKKQEKKIFQNNPDFSGRYGRFPEANIIYRYHHDPLVIKTMNDWWFWIKNYSKRDQLSLVYVLWKNKLKFSLLSRDSYRFCEDIAFIYSEKHYGGENNHANAQELEAVLNGTQKELEKTRAELHRIKNSRSFIVYNFMQKIKYYLNHENT